MAAPQLSRTTYDRLRVEFEDLTTRGRIEVAEEIERAREEGDLKENAGYHAAKDKQGHMEGRIRQLEHLLEAAQVVNHCPVYTFVFEGDSEADAERYMIGHIEEQPPEGVELMGTESPLGSALIGAEAGETVSYQVPNGKTLKVRVLSVEWI
jgi:transcription elongation factor GreA